MVLSSKMPVKRAVTARGGARGAVVRCRAEGIGAGLRTCHGGAHLSASNKAELERVAALIATPGKGITACDEGPGTIGGRFEAVGLKNSEEARRSYRQMLFESNFLSWMRNSLLAAGLTTVGCMLVATSAAVFHRSSVHACPRIQAKYRSTNTRPTSSATSRGFRPCHSAATG